MMTFIAVLVLWIFTGLVYFYNRLGVKREPDPWYAWIILLPLIVVSTFFGACRAAVNLLAKTGV